MCGIAAIVSKNPIDEKIVSESLYRFLLKRGPDNHFHKLYDRNHILLLHTRLSIIDLSDSANQPMASHGSLAEISFNGEIVNYKKLRAKLVEEGVDFRTNSDTEVILEGYLKYGTTFFEQLRGMYAFAIYDKVRNKLIVTRDKMGIKPLYFYNGCDTIGFSSDPRALIKGLGLNKDLSKEGIINYLRFGYTGHNYSIFEEIIKVLPGELIAVDLENFSVKRESSSFEYYKSEISNDVETEINNLKNLISEILEEWVTADVPVGMLLSGGLDSSLVAAILKKDFDVDLTAFTIGFPDHTDERTEAANIANYLGIKHHSFELSETDIFESLSEYAEIFPEPFSDNSFILLNCISKHIKKTHKLVLSSDGGDELFGGYSKYKSQFKRGRYLARSDKFLKGMNKIIDVHSLLKKSSNPVLSKLGDFLLMESSNKGVWDILNKGYSDSLISEATRLTEISNVVDSSLQLNSKSKLVAQMALDYDMQNFMPNDLMVKIDRVTMFHGIEARPPLLDERLYAYSRALPMHYKYRDGNLKWIERRLLEEYLPANLMDKKKKGFSINFEVLMEKYFSESIKSEILETGEVIFSESFLKNIAHQKQSINPLLLWRGWLLAKWYNKSFKTL